MIRLCHGQATSHVIVPIARKNSTVKFKIINHSFNIQRVSFSNKGTWCAVPALTILSRFKVGLLMPLATSLEWFVNYQAVIEISWTTMYSLRARAAQLLPQTCWTPSASCFCGLPGIIVVFHELVMDRDPFKWAVFYCGFFVGFLQVKLPWGKQVSFCPLYN